MLLARTVTILTSQRKSQRPSEFQQHTRNHTFISKLGSRTQSRRLKSHAWHYLPPFLSKENENRIESQSLSSDVCCLNMTRSLGLCLLFIHSFIHSDCIYLFLERGESREEEREKIINVWLSLACPLLGTWPATQACALTGNQTGNLLVLRPVSPQSTEPHQPGLTVFISRRKITIWQIVDYIIQFNRRRLII